MRDPERERLRDEPGARSGPDPAAGGGPHASVPREGRPTWEREEPGQGRRGWWLAVLVIVGVTLAFWLAAQLYGIVIEGRTDAPEPGASGRGAGYPTGPSASP